MNIALMAHDNKKELMVQFCTAYAGILSRHTLCATSVTGKMVSEASGLPIHLFMARIHGGARADRRAHLLQRDRYGPLLLRPRQPAVITTA